jgi:DNA-binding XRE family transcriptional regulator
MAHQAEDGRWGSVEPGQFGELLKLYETQAGLTQEELTDRAGLSAPAIHDLERGPRRSPQSGKALGWPKPWGSRRLTAPSSRVLEARTRDLPAAGASRLARR